MSGSNAHDLLFSRICDGAAEQEEIREFHRLLKAEPEVLDAWLRFASLHGELLAGEIDGPAMRPGVIAMMPQPAARKVWRAGWPLAAAAAIAILLSAAWLLSGGPRRAVVTRSVGASLADGAEIRGRKVQIDEGWVEIRSEKGAEIVVEAPAQFCFEQAERLHLYSGRLSANVPPSAHGFTVVTSAGEVIDLGTRFGVDASETRPAEVHVFEGEVIAQATGKRSLRTGEAATLGKAGLAASGFRDAAFVQAGEMPLLAAGLGQGQQKSWLKQRAAYQQDPALLTWQDFENADARRYEGRYSVVQGRWPGSRAMEFMNVGDYAQMPLNGQAAEFSLLAWVRLDQLPNEMQSIYHGEGYNQRPGVVHWMFRPDKNMLLAVSGTERVGEDPERAGDRYRKYPSSRQRLRESLGRWTLLAVTYDADRGVVRFYHDGVFDNEERVNPGVVADFRQGRLGNWDERERLLSGRLDEFVVLRRVLTDEEIQTFHRDTTPYR